MAPTTTTPSTFDPPKSAPNGNHVPLSKTTTTDSTPSTNSIQAPPPKHVPTLTAVLPEAPKNYKDVLAYEDKWIGWDGPVWCKRYGRFENADDAAKDDGFESSGQVHHQDSGPLHKHCEGCNTRTPIEHHSYVEDIKRRIEPMVTSLVGLEHQIAKLAHHMGVQVHELMDDKLVQDTEVMDNHHKEGNERFAMHDDGLSHFANRRAPSQSEALAKLEGKVHALEHQMHDAMTQGGSGYAFARST